MSARIAGVGVSVALVVSFGAAGAEPAVQVVPAARIAALAAQIARSQVSDPDRALVPAFALGDQRVPAGALALTPGAVTANATYVSVPIAIDVDGRLARTVFTGFRVTSYVRTVVAARDLLPGELIAAGDLTYAALPYAGRPGVAFESLVGRKIRTAVMRGDAVLAESTSVNEIVHAGMPAVLIVHDGPVNLAADVVARSSGGLGDYVSTFDPQTQRVLTGVVTGPNTIELILPGASE
jgi:flagella basal body P-ring formation protein FlgA